MTVGGVGFTFVTVTVPFALVRTRIGATTTRPRADVNVVLVVVDDAVVVVAGVVVVG
jgi:hypothetical protein